MNQPDPELEALLGAPTAATLVADLREAHQHLRAASERLREWRTRRDGGERQGASPADDRADA